MHALYMGNPLKARMNGQLVTQNGVDYLKGCRIIYPGSLLHGGVYVGINPQEALLVDGDSVVVDRLFYDVLSRSHKNRVVHKKCVLQSISDVVSETYRIRDPGAVKDVLATHGTVDPDSIVPLTLFMDKGIGTSRHYALTCGILIERLHKEFYGAERLLRGTPSIERTADESHVWCRYIREGGRVQSPQDRDFLFDAEGDRFTRYGDARHKYYYQAIRF